jgi:hypothetical protein
MAEIWPFTAVLGRNAQGPACRWREPKGVAKATSGRAQNGAVEDDPLPATRPTPLGQWDHRSRVRRSPALRLQAPGGAGRGASSGRRRTRRAQARRARHRPPARRAVSLARRMHHECRVVRRPGYPQECGAATGVSLRPSPSRIAAPSAECPNKFRVAEAESRPTVRWTVGSHHPRGTTRPPIGVGARHARV